MTFKKKHLWALVASTSLTLAGCGGGSSDSGSSSSGGGNTEPNRVSLTGLAVKGVMANATITVSSLDGLTTYDSTTTGSDGTYSLADMNLPLNTALLVTMTTNANTMLTCDSAVGCTDAASTEWAFGEDYAFNDPNFRMTAVLAPMSAINASLTLMVTPVTNMAAERVLQTGVSSADDIAAVNTATANLLGLDGVDIATAKPSDITDAGATTDDLASQRYGALVAGFATLAASSDKSITDVIKSVSDDYAEDGGLYANSSSEDIIDLADLFSSAAESATEADLLVAASEYSAETVIAASAAEDTWVEATAETTTKATNQAEAVDKAVALLEDLNDWSSAVEGAGQQLTALATEYGSSLSDMTSLFDDESQALRGVRELLIEQNGDATTPGVLFQATDISANLVTMAGYVLAHSDVLDENGMVSAADLINDGVDLDIAEWITTDGEIIGDVEMTFSEDEGFSVTGYNGEGVEITSGSFVMGVPTEGNFLNPVAYQISNLVMTDGTLTFASDGVAVFEFVSAEAQQAFQNATTDGDLEVSVASISDITFYLDSMLTGAESDASVSNFSVATATLSTELAMTQDAEGLMAAEATVTIDVSSADGDYVSGVISFSADGLLTETGSETFYTQEFDPESMSIGFMGSALVTSIAGDSAAFVGSATLAGSDPLGSIAALVGGSGVSGLNGGVVLNGGLVGHKVARAGGAGASDLAFSGTMLMGTGDDETGLLDSRLMVLSGTFDASYSGIDMVGLDLTASTIQGYDVDAGDYFSSMSLDLDASTYGYKDGSIHMVSGGYGEGDLGGEVRLSYGSAVVVLNFDKVAGLASAEDNQLLISDGSTIMTITATCAEETVDADIGACDGDMKYGGSIVTDGFDVGTLEERDGLPVFVFDNGSEYTLVMTPSFMISANP
jgi:hypothetical protein